MTKQQCTKCLTAKPLTSKHFERRKDRGVLRWRKVCKACMAISDKVYRAATANGTFKPTTRSKDWSGQKLHYLTLLVRHPKRRAGHVVWRALCDCGKKTVVWPQNVILGKTTSCGCKRSEYYKKPHHRKWPPMISTARTVWGAAYNDGDCDFNTFFNLSQQPCWYCKRLPFLTYNIAKNVSYRTFSEDQFNNGNFTYNGLDRIDSSKGHDIGNIVPCCHDCNMAKLDKTMSEFLAHIERMYQGTHELRSAQKISSGL
jgi:hypothetical protein